MEKLTDPNLGDPLSNVLTEERGAVKVLHEMWNQAENVQGKTYWIKIEELIKYFTGKIILKRRSLECNLWRWI